MKSLRLGSLSGNSSENRTHITGPRDTAKQATKPRMPAKIRRGFMLMAADISSPSKTFDFLLDLRVSISAALKGHVIIKTRHHQIQIGAPGVLRKGSEIESSFKP